jgi:hypothetical protein
MSKLTILSEAQLGATDAESIQVVYVEPDGMPSSVIILWPQRRFTVSPRDFPAVAVTLTRVFAQAATKLAGRKSGR